MAAKCRQDGGNFGVHQILVAPVSIGTAMITPVHFVRDFGIYVDSKVLMRSNVAKTVLSCFAVHPKPNVQHSWVSHLAGTVIARRLIDVDTVGLRSTTLAGLLC